MGFCGSCGTRVDDEGRFCGNCGQPVGDPTPPTQPFATADESTSPRQPATATAQLPPVLPPAPLGPPPSTPPPSAPPPSAPPRPPAPPQVDLTFLLRGNWVAAGATAATAFGTALLGSLVVIVLLAPGLGAWDWLVSVAALTASVFTVDASGGVSGGDVDVAATFGTVPLVLTTVSLGAACWVFRRLTRTTTSLTAALGDAARAGLMLGIVLLFVAIVFRTGLEDQTGAVNEFLGFFDMDGLEADAGISRASALFVGFLVLFGVLALACLLRRDWLPPRLQQVHDLVAAPLYAAAALVVALPALGAICYLALLTGSESRSADDDLSWNQTIGVLLVAVSNAGMHFLGIGAGARWGGSYEFEGEGEYDADDQYGRLAGLVDDSDAWGLWFSVPVMLVVIGLLTWFVLHRSRGHRPLGNLLAWSGLSFVVFTTLTRLASAHGSGDVEFDAFGESGEGEASFFGGIPFADTLLLGLLATVAAVGLAALSGLIDPKAVASQLQRLQAPSTTPRPPGPPPSMPPTTAQPTVPPPPMPPPAPPTMPPTGPPGSIT